MAGRAVKDQVLWRRGFGKVEYYRRDSLGFSEWVSDKSQATLLTWKQASEKFHRLMSTTRAGSGWGYSYSHKDVVVYD